MPFNGFSVYSPLENLRDELSEMDVLETSPKRAVFPRTTAVLPVLFFLASNAGNGCPSLAAGVGTGVPLFSRRREIKGTGHVDGQHVAQVRRLRASHQAAKVSELLTRPLGHVIAQPGGKLVELNWLAS